MRDIIASTFLGMPLVAWGGLFTLSLVVLQVLMGAKILKVNFKYHRINGYLILGVALVHATAALIYIFG